MTFYPIVPGSKASGGSGPPMASDVNQYARAFNAEEDAGTLQLAPPVATPLTAPTATVTTGTALAIGAYVYAVAYVTGHRRDDATLVVSGETTAGPTVSVTTTSGNQSVSLTSLPTSSAASVIGKRIYRSAVGGTSLYLVATIAAGQTSYVDTMDDNTIGVPVTRTLTFVGKVAGSTVANPHVTRPRVAATFDAPASFTLEFDNTGYTQISALGGGAATTSSVTNLLYGQQLFAFDVYNEFLRAGAIPSSWDGTALKAHVKSLVWTWYGYGAGSNAGVAANGATLKARDNALSTWSGTVSHTSGSITTLSNATDATNSKDYIDSSGLMHILAHSTYASNGTIASAINTDYVKLDVTVRTAPAPTSNTTGTRLLGYVGEGLDNRAVSLVKTLRQDYDTRSIVLTYTGSNVTKVEEKDGAVVVKTTDLVYASSRVSTVTEVVGGKTITTNLTYNADGSLASTTRTVT